MAISFVLVAISGLPFKAAALTVSPPRLEFSGDPGQTISATYILINEEVETRIFFSSFANFEASGETGVPKFLEAQEGLATWIDTLPSVTLKSREEKEVPFSIRIPKNAEPGGHFAAIFWGTTPSQTTGGGQIAIGGKVGILVLLRVSGEVSGGGGLLEFNTKDDKRFFTSLPIEFFWRFRNDSGNRIQPEGEIIVKNTFGFTTTKLPANLGKGNILPASIRKFSVPWVREGEAADEEKAGFFAAVKKQWSEFHFGYYKTTLNLKYGGNGEKEAKSSFGFVIVPWQLLSIIVVILSVLGFLSFIGLRKYNSWIIKKARQSNFK